jgi:hypothetical protein
MVWVLTRGKLAFGFSGSLRINVVDVGNAGMAMPFSAIRMFATGRILPFAAMPHSKANFLPLVVMVGNNRGNHQRKDSYSDNGYGYCFSQHVHY